MQLSTQVHVSVCHSQYLASRPSYRSTPQGGNTAASFSKRQQWRVTTALSCLWSL